MTRCAKREEAETEGYRLVMTAVETETGGLARSLVQARPAACVQVRPMRSTYRWEGEVRCDGEWMLVVKTRAELYPAVERHIREGFRWCGRALSWPARWRSAYDVSGAVARNPV